MRDRRGVDKKRVEDLLRLISFCKTIQSAETDPFDLDVRHYLAILREYLKRWRSIEDLLLDGEAVSELAKVIERQCKWIKDRSTSFYLDPALIELKLKLMEPAQLASAFFKAWHPVVSLDMLTPERLKEGLEYWNALLPLNERKRGLVESPLSEAGGGTIGFEDLIALRIFSETEFREQLQALQAELEARGRTEYHDFVYVDDFGDSIRRAYLTSYLVSEGSAGLDIEPLEEKIYLYPLPAGAPTQRMPVRMPKSVPIAISYEDWHKWRKKREQEQSGR